MRKLSSLARFRLETLKIKSQQEFAEKLGYGDKGSTYGAHERGTNAIPPETKELLRGPQWNYTGPWPDEEDEDEADTELLDQVKRLRGEVDGLRRTQLDLHEKIVELATVVHALQSLDNVKSALAAFQKK